MFLLIGIASLAACFWFLMGLAIEWGKAGTMQNIAWIGVIIFGGIAIMCLT
jgi:hypothetical protein